jgi:hypothetical protein
VRRLHFHEFMQAVHRRHHELEAALPQIVVRSRLGLPVHRCVVPAAPSLPVHRCVVPAAPPLPVHRCVVPAAPPLPMQ